MVQAVGGSSPLAHPSKSCSRQAFLDRADRTINLVSAGRLRAGDWPPLVGARSSVVSGSGKESVIFESDMALLCVEANAKRRSSRDDLGSRRGVAQHAGGGSCRWVASSCEPGPALGIRGRHRGRRTRARVQPFPLQTSPTSPAQRLAGTPFDPRQRIASGRSCHCSRSRRDQPERRVRYQTWIDPCCE